ncbi:hypothetical protein Pcinc_041629 [Petrolisthes cinctipes]|uniref:Transmembrane protein n=1 Tax=Petrolisthes cinctipes TaxID=88211 RepID=A0AAE1BMU7_PETCI|nr:hypothetical protein Pcinc_041629 [Petrolisthes cinctipes]
MMKRVGKVGGEMGEKLGKGGGKVEKWGIGEAMVLKTRRKQYITNIIAVVVVITTITTMDDGCQDGITNP